MKAKQTTPKLPSIAAIAAIVKSLKNQICDDCRCSDDPGDDTPGILVTFGASGDSRDDWNFQSGDNSFTGGAYGFPFWGVGYIYRKSNCREIAKDILAEIEDSWFMANS